MRRLVRVLVLAAATSAVAAVACVETLPHLMCTVPDVEALPSSNFPDKAEGDCISCMETPCCDSAG